MKNLIKIFAVLFVVQFCAINLSYGEWEGYFYVEPDGPQACDSFKGTVQVYQNSELQSKTWNGYMEYSFYFDEIPNNGFASGYIYVENIYTDPHQSCEGFNTIYWSLPPISGHLTIPIDLTYY